MKQLRLRRRVDGWWVTNTPQATERIDDCGPYEIRKEANEARIGLERTLRSRQWKDIEVK